jgi:cytochrome c-type biogenesis protein CcmH/NrfG
MVRKERIPVTNSSKTKQWTGTRATTLAVACLFAGIVGGWFLRAAQPPSVAGSSNASASSTVAPSPTNDPARMKTVADAQAAPLLEQLKASPADPALLADIGNVYYDAQQYPAAIDFYGRSLTSAPDNVSVRTDLGTAYWYTGNADAAIAEFNKALTYQPTNANTLFNLGLVKWKGKSDAAGAVADWRKLLAANPTYDGKENVEKLMAEAKK